MRITHSAVTFRSVDTKNCFTGLQPFPALNYSCITYLIAHRHIRDKSSWRNPNMLHTAYLLHNRSDIISSYITIVHDVKNQFTLFIGINGLITIFVYETNVRYL